MSKLSSRHSILIYLLLAGFYLPGTSAGVDLPFVDSHVHFNWDQKEITEASDVVAKLRRGGVVFAVVSSTPSELALELQRAGPDIVLPIFSPYTHQLGRRDWYLNDSTLRRAEAGLRQGLYHGIGEVHFMAGFRPRPDNQIFEQLLQLAARYDVPVLIHIDAANEQMFLSICRRYPDLKLIFAHAGGNLYPRHIRKLIAGCSNVTVEISARDPWRFDGLTDDDGRLLEGWRELVIEFPGRFMTGTDPVWKVTRTQTWDQSDEGWDYFEQLIDYHRRWIDDLPPAVQQQISHENARRLFGWPRGRE